MPPTGSFGGGDGIGLRFRPDLSDVRAALDELENTPINVRIQPRDAAGRFRSYDYGITPYGGVGQDPPSMQREDAAPTQRLLESNMGDTRVNRLIDQDNVHRLNIPGAQPRYVLGDGGPGWTGGSPFAGTPGWGGWAGAVGGGGSPGGPGGFSGGGDGGRAGFQSPWGGGYTPTPQGSTAGLGRFFGIGLAIREVLHALRETQEYGTEMTEAGDDPAAQLTATLKYRRRLTDLPIAGNLVGLLSDPTGIGLAAVERIQKTATAQDKSTQEMATSQEFYKRQHDLTDVALTRGDFSKREVEAAQVRDRAREAATAKYREDTARFAKERGEAFTSADIEYQADQNQPVFNVGGFAFNERSIEQIASRLGQARNAAQVGYKNLIDRAGERNDAAQADVERRYQEQLRLIERDRYTTAVGPRLAQLGGNALQLAGLGDEAQQYLVRSKIAIEAAGAEDPQIKAAIQRAGLSELTLLRNQQGQRATLRGVTDEAFITGTLADTAKIPGVSALAQVGVQNLTDLQNAQLTEVPRTIVKDLTRTLHTMVDVGRELEQTQDDAEAAAGISGLRARGDDYGAARLGVRQRLRRQLQTLPHDDPITNLLLQNLPQPVQDFIVRTRAAFRSSAASDEAAITRQEGFATQGLRNEVDVTNALALGNEPGGFRRTAEVRRIADDTALQASEEADPTRRGLRLQTGVNLLSALQRDLISGAGAPQEVTPGTLGPGFTGTGTEDTQKALDELTEAIKKLTEELQNTQEWSGGDSSGGDF